MAVCPLTSSYTYAGCKGGGGGIKEDLIIEIENISAVTVSAGNIVTAITRVATKVFRRYQLDKEMGSASSNLTFTPASGTLTYEPKVDFTIKNFSTAIQTEIKLLGGNTTVHIVRDVNDVYRIYGLRRGLDLITATEETGTAYTDRNGFTLSFAGKEVEQAYVVDPTIIAALLVP